MGPPSLMWSLWTSWTRQKSSNEETPTVWMPAVSCLRQLGVCYEFTVGQHSIASPRGSKVLRTEFCITDLALTDHSNDLTSSFSLFLRWSYKGKGQGAGKEGGKWPGRHPGPSSLPSPHSLLPGCNPSPSPAVSPTKVPLQSFPVCHPCCHFPIQVTISALQDCRNHHPSGLSASLLPLYSPFSIKTSRFLKNAQQSMALPCYITFNGSPAPWHYCKIP